MESVNASGAMRWHDGGASEGSPEPSTYERWLLPVLIPILGWVLGASVFFRDQLRSGFTAVTGDEGDARLAVVIHEHWYRVVQGEAGWRDPTFFHPAKGVLGYTDTFVLNALLYIPLRLLRLDVFLAFEVTLILLSLIGFVSMYLLLRRHFHLWRFAAVAGSLLYCFPNNLYVQIGHIQMLSTWWWPPIVLAGFEAARGHTRQVRACMAAACGAGISLLALSSFYVSWTLLLMTAAATVVGTLLMPVKAARQIRSAVASRAPEMATAAMAMAVGAVPFFLTYLPTFRRTGGRSYAELQLLAALPGDLINVTGKNFVWGGLLRRLYGPENPRLNVGEQALAVTPLLLLFSLVSLVVVVIVERRHGQQDLRPPPRPPAWPASLAVAAALAVVLLPVRWNGLRLWYPVWAYIPGASVIRATARMEIIASQVLAVVLVFCLSRSLDLLGLRVRDTVRLSVAALVVVALPITEQLNVGRSSQIDRPAQEARLAAAPPPPSTCRSFFVTDSGPQRAFFVLEIDAMLLAQKVGVPTVNGYSGQLPDGWSLNGVQSPGYLDTVRSWATKTGIADGLCAYDLTTHIWDADPLR